MQTFLFIAGLATIIVLLIINSNGKAKQRAKLRKQYQDALNGTDKGAALKAGRAFYSDLRDGKLTIYDEQAITNDLASMRVDEVKTNRGEEALDKLERLAQLRSKGLLTDFEFDQQKARILQE